MIKKHSSISEAARRLDKALGSKGVEITIGSEETGGIKSYFTNKLPPLEIGKANAKRTIEVEVSSIEHENKELLHYLFSKTRS
ncbi:MAG: hypothetical protein ACOYMZ_03480 [Minisyncoccia bacterium]